MQLNIVLEKASP